MAIKINDVIIFPSQRKKSSERKSEFRNTNVSLPRLRIWKFSALFDRYSAFYPSPPERVLPGKWSAEIRAVQTRLTRRRFLTVYMREGISVFSMFECFFFSFKKCVKRSVLNFCIRMFSCPVMDGRMWSCERNRVNEDGFRILFSEVCHRCGAEGKDFGSASLFWPPPPRIANCISNRVPSFLVEKDFLLFLPRTLLVLVLSNVNSFFCNYLLTCFMS